MTQNRIGLLATSFTVLHRVNLLNTMQLAANLSDTIAREMCHRKSETFAKNYFTFDPS